MAYRHRKAVAIALLLTLSPLTVAAELFRYEDEQGRIVWGDAVPPHLLDKGFSVYDTNGYLIRTVERTVTVAEEASVEREEAARLAGEVRRQQQIDNMLLRRYGTLKEYQDRRMSAMSNLNDRRAAINVRLGDVNRNIDEISATVLQAEQENRNPPAGLDSLLANLEGVRAGLQDDIAEANEEIARFVEQSDQEYQRLSELLEAGP